MKHFLSFPKSAKRKFSSSLLFPIYGLCGLLLVIGFYRLHDISAPASSVSYENVQVTDPKQQEADFEAYLNNLFQTQVTSNTLNLHYTLADPSSADISSYPVTFGEISSKKESEQLAALENMKNELHTFHPSSMSVSAQLAYDVLDDSLTRSLELAPFRYYEELLSSTGGVQSEYPILLAEYAFHSVKDIEDYLTLLSQYDTFFEQICTFEKEKAKKGLFMNETAVNNVIEQCRAFVPEDSKNSFWETTFQERLNQLKTLSKKEKQAYIKQNHELLQEHVYPAYHNMIAVLKALKKEGKNNQGLCYFKDGKKYYELLVKSTTGSDRSIPNLQEMVEKQRDKNLAALTLAASKLEQNTSSKTLPYQAPEDMLEHLKKKIKAAFPAAPQANYMVKNVNEKLFI